VCQVVLLFSLGYFSTKAIVDRTVYELSYYLVQALFFLISTIDIDFSLATKVHADGHLLVVGLDRKGRELFKLYMN